MHASHARTNTPACTQQQRNTRIGRDLSGALIATLAGMALANIGYMAPHPPQARVVFAYVLPLAIPMLLLSADLRRILR